jgi:CRP/FNR family cyclic AMP-dependent transcriptional regulator
MRHKPANPLSGLPVFAGLSDKALGQAESLLTQVDLPAGYVMCEEGRIAHEAFVILDGTADVVRNDEVVATVGRGAVVGEVALLNADRRRTATVRTTTPVVAMVMSPREFDSLRQLPGVDDEIRRIVEERHPVADS